jgi:hydroxymethylpyrimidine/phosphomethylpyrimidine kinase
LVAPGLVLELLSRLIPACTLLKPNLGEARVLCPDAADPDAIGRRLSNGTDRCRFALLTGSDAPGARDATHYLYRSGELFARFRYPLLPGRYHGTGCTVTTSIACMLAWGASCETAVGLALDFTWRAIRAAYSTGGVQAIPNRANGLAGIRIWP